MRGELQCPEIAPRDSREMLDRKMLIVKPELGTHLENLVGSIQAWWYGMMF